MIVVLARVTSTRGDIEALREVLAEMEQATRAEEGCHDYVFCQEISDPERIRVVELWDSMEALTAHFGTPHMARFNAALAERPPRAMTLEVHELGTKLELPSPAGGGAAGA